MALEKDCKDQGGERWETRLAVGMTSMNPSYRGKSSAVIMGSEVFGAAYSLARISSDRVSGLIVREGSYVCQFFAT